MLNYNKIGLISLWKRKKPHEQSEALIVDYVMKNRMSTQKNPEDLSWNFSKISVFLKNFGNQD